MIKIKTIKEHRISITDRYVGIYKFSVHDDGGPIVYGIQAHTKGIFGKEENSSELILDKSLTKALLLFEKEIRKEKFGWDITMLLFITGLTCIGIASIMQTIQFNKNN